jgi:hypothetical protein
VKRIRGFALALLCLVATCSVPPTPEQIATRDRFVRKMGVRIESLDCEPTTDWFGRPWVCSALVANGSPAKFWCADDGCRWTK